jgi:DNA-binding MarR family transcriptional regulator
MKNNKQAGTPQLHDVDRLIHEPARYNIMALLYVVEKAEFLFIQNQTGLTPGNLSSHLGRLEKAKYLKIQKKFVRRMPKTFLSLTVNGRSAFEQYREKMRALFTGKPGMNRKNV